jgi:glycosyltransferase involved in cell wall biosynthesis
VNATKNNTGCNRNWLSSTCELMNTDDITPLVITFNEEDNLERTLDALTWARRIVLIDSGSNDGTLLIAARYKNVTIIHHSFSTFADQCNFGLKHITTRWVLSLDADYQLSDSFQRELDDIVASRDVVGYRASFIYRIYGRPLRGAFYPPRTVLYRASIGRYVNEGHSHRIIVKGAVKNIRSPIFHDDRKPLARWFSSQQTYVRSEADYLEATETKLLSIADRIRKSGWAAPALIFIYSLFIKRCIMDGWPGWFYTIQRTIAESMLALELADRRLRRLRPSHDD